MGVQKRAAEQADRARRRPRVERREQRESRIGHSAPALVVAEVLAFIGVHQVGEAVVAVGDVGNGHAAAECAVVVHGCRALTGAERAPTEGVEPACGHHDERRQHVAQVVVADVVHRVHLVDPSHGCAAFRTVEPAQLWGLKQQRGVVVAPLAHGGELPGLVELSPDARHGVGAEGGQAQRLIEVPGEL
ncbi:MAG: hypothetical protein ACRCSN_13945 [Dermatophilaceae bacterium]